MKRILALILSISLLMSDIAPVAYAVAEEAVNENTAVENVLIDNTLEEETETDIIVENEAETQLPEETLTEETEPEQTEETPADVQKEELSEKQADVEEETQEEAVLETHNEVDMEIRVNLAGDMVTWNWETPVKVIRGNQFRVYAYDNLAGGYAAITHKTFGQDDYITAEIKFNGSYIEVKVPPEAANGEYNLYFQAEGRQYGIPFHVVQDADVEKIFDCDGGTYGQIGVDTAEVTGGNNINLMFQDFANDGFIPVTKITVFGPASCETTAGDVGIIRVPAGAPSGEYEATINAGGRKHTLTFKVKSWAEEHAMGNGVYWYRTSDGTLVIDWDGTGSGEMDIDSVFAPWYDSRYSIYGVKVMPGVTSIDNGAFENLEYASFVEFVSTDVSPCTVKTIESAAFQGMRSLTEITLPESLEYLGDACFRGTGITNLYIPENATNITAGVFKDMENLNSISVSPDNVKYSTDGKLLMAATYNDSLEIIAIIPAENIYLPDNVTQIHGHVISGADKTKEVYVSDTHPAFKSVGGVLYSKDGTKLVWYPMARTETTYTVPDGVKTINEWAFAQTGFLKTGLTEIVLPTSLETIGYCAFSNAETIKTLRYKGTQSQWEKYVYVEQLHGSNSQYNEMTVLFEGTEVNGKAGNLDWTLMDDLMIISGNGAMPDYEYVNDAPWYQYKGKIKRVVIEEGVTVVGQNAFYGYGITELTLPEGLEEIHAYAFSDYFAKELTLPSTVKYIGSWAFAFANYLEDGEIYIPASTTIIDPMAFASGSKLQNIYVNGNNPNY
ncbi:MAG: leucine-rich repeat protein, partial [Oscillospiraceae bacterium]|nr:leucine-rich repeat protein [Oscillospiraceae bacterium]